MYTYMYIYIYIYIWYMISLQSLHTQVKKTNKFLRFISINFGSEESTCLLLKKNVEVGDKGVQQIEGF